MHPRQLCIALIGLAALAAQAAVVYKWTDANGVVHFSDQPVPGAEKIVTAGPASAKAAPPSGSPVPGQAPPPPGSPAEAVAQFAISSPAPGQTFFGDEAVSVHLDLAPPLRQGQTLTWHLNGKELDQGASATQFTLPHLDRGTYAIAATLTDQATGESKSTASVSFFVRQPSEFAPLRSRP
jgi:hypothetical protein